jgi:hypothetical protein
MLHESALTVLYWTHHKDTQAEDPAENQFSEQVSLIAISVRVLLTTHLFKGNCVLITSGMGIRSIIKSDETLNTVAVIMWL